MTIFITLLTFSYLTTPSGPHPDDVLKDLNSKEAKIRSKAASIYANNCRSGPSRHLFRRHRSINAAFAKTLRDPDSTVRINGIEMSVCLQPNKAIEKLAPLVSDRAAQVSLAAMTRLAHLENPLGSAAVIQWLTKHQKTCLNEQSDLLERCIFAAYTLGQTSQHEPPGAATRLKVNQTLKRFIAAPSAKLREVTVVALSFSGHRNDTKSILKLIAQEKTGTVKNPNSPTVISQFESIAQQLKQSKE